MSLRKLCFFAALAAMAALALLAWFSNPNSRRSHPLNASLAQTDVPAFLPVQSKNTKDLAAGKLLVASRNLGDPNFMETVVLLVHYDDEGAVGLVLNRRSHVPIYRVLEGLDAAKDRSDPVYLGGPVEKSSVFGLLQSPAKVEGAKSIFDGVKLISSKDLFEQTMSAKPAPGAFHVYLGYAGWTREQLRTEVELGAWFIFPADAQSVFNSDPDSLWSQMIRKTELRRAENHPDRRNRENAAMRLGAVGRWSSAKLQITSLE
jgi:putative AlgH/UPF0301 family transcriptional regulator